MQARTRSFAASAALAVAALATLVSSPSSAQSMLECPTTPECYGACPSEGFCSSCSELALVCRGPGDPGFSCETYQIQAFCAYWT